MTEEDAEALVAAELRIMNQRWSTDLVVLRSLTVQKRYGWVFFYDSMKHIETQDIMDSIAGNGPVVVIAATGEVVLLGTRLPADEELAEFERSRSLNS